MVRAYGRQAGVKAVLTDIAEAMVYLRMEAGAALSRTELASAARRFNYTMFDVAVSGESWSDIERRLE